MTDDRRTKERKSEDEHIRQGLRCKLCNDTIVSMSHHDFVRCRCGACFVDGGGSYFRCGGQPENIEFVDVDITVLGGKAK